jgi:urea transport system permease protein
LAIKRFNCWVFAWCLLLAPLALLAAEVSSEQTVTADSDAAPVIPTTLPELWTALAQASLSDAVALVEQIEKVGGRDALPVFSAMMEGELYVEPTSKQLLRVVTNNDLTVVSDVHTGAVSTVSADTLEKVRTNNKLRGMLRAATARISLSAGTPAERQTAALSVLNNLDDDSVGLLQVALAQETDADVRSLLAVGIAMQSLVTASDDDTRVAAIIALDGRLEPPVRNLLESVGNSEGDRYSEKVKSAARNTMASIDSSIQFYHLLEQLFFGLSLGSVLLLAAIGLAVTFGVMGVINMAHGEMLMLGAYTTYVVQLLMPNHIDQSLWVAIPAAFIVTALVGMLIQRFVIRYLNGRPLETLLATFGISLILQQAVRTIFSPLNRLVESPSWMSGSLQINPVLGLTNNRMFILLFSLIVFVILMQVLKRTSLGLHVRAVSQNRAMAQAMGIRTDVVDALTFGLGSGIAGIAGVALSQLTNVGPNLGQSYIIDSFMVVVFGGVGNLWGTLLAAFSLGMTSKFLEPLTGAVLANILILIFIILFIQKRPKGLFPQKGRAAE